MDCTETSWVSHSTFPNPLQFCFKNWALLEPAVYNVLTKRSTIPVEKATSSSYYLALWSIYLHLSYVLLTAWGSVYPCPSSHSFYVPWIIMDDASTKGIFLLSLFLQFDLQQIICSSFGTYGVFRWEYDYFCFFVHFLLPEICTYRRKYGAVAPSISLFSSPTFF